MRLRKIVERLHSIDPVLKRPEADPEITAVTEDSRRVVPGALFVAIVGDASDGHEHAEAAAEAGATAILGARPGATKLAGLPYLSTPRPRAAAGVAAHALAGDPSRDLCVIGVTGTNGKSSTIRLIQSILTAAGHKTASFGTLGYDIAGTVLDAPYTTPFGEDLAAIFSQARDAGCSHAAMEVSSHALDQERVAGIAFDVAAYTNFTRDHLDYHGGMDNYLGAKLKLFEHISGPGSFVVVNADDAQAELFSAAAAAPCHSFGAAGDCRAMDIEMRPGAVTWRLESPWGEARIEMRLLGKHNIWNALCAAAVCGGLEVPVETIAAGLGGVSGVPGRFEAIDAGQDFQVIVDYAHTDDGLRSVLEAAREICGGKLIVLFGCGGGRDRGKRPKMGAVAAERADFAVLTSDNPRTEDPYKILLDVEIGMRRAGREKGKDYTVIVSREEAIAHAIGLASAGDLVMIAGKGHEDYQILGTERIHFDDREIARRILEAAQ